MLDSTRPARRTVCFLIAGLIFAPACPVLASGMGQAAAARVSLDTYRYYLDDMLYTHAGDDRGFGPEHDLAQANIYMLLESFGLSVELEPVDYYGETYYNVVGTKLGSTYPEQEYIIGGHYDSVSNPGADDNASGVALVLEAARVLSPFESEYTIRFVAFDREEQGLYGSSDYVDAHIDDDILGMISADMVAYNTGAESVTIYGRSASNPLKNALAQAVATYGDSLNSSLGGPLDASDHAPFEWEGFQACLIIEQWGNPYYHTPQDNVDMPDYINYAYATRITRSVVGFLVDHAGVLVDLPDGDFDDDGEVNMYDYGKFSDCFTGSGGGPVGIDCLAGDFDLDDDIDCADWSQFVDAWTETGDPPTLLGCSTVALAPPPPPHDRRRNRFISFDPNNPEVNMAIAVELLDLACSSTGLPCTYDSDCKVCVGGSDDGLACTIPSDCSGGTCEVSQETCDEQSPPALLGWVGEPFEPDTGDTPPGTFTSLVVPEPVYRVWSEAVIHVGDCEIAPVRSYALSATEEGNFFTAPLRLDTIRQPQGKFWADVVGAFDSTEWTEPNGLVNVDDAVALIQFVTLKPAPHVTVLDVDGEVPNFTINVTDLQLILQGFQGRTYPPAGFSNQGGPLGCP